MQAAKQLETERLSLRQLKESDFPAYAAFYADAEQAKYVGGQKNPDQVWRSIALLLGHWQLKGYGYWALEHKTNDRFIGCAGLWQSAGWPELELGYWISPEQQGKGYAYEAAGKVRDYAQHTLNMPSLVSYIAAENHASIKLAEKLGASYDTTIELAEHGPHRVYRYF